MEKRGGDGMFFSTSKKLTLLLAAVILTFSIAGVFASWNYATADANSEHTNLVAGLEVFAYKPEEVLPGVEMNQIGQNHQTVIERVVDDVKYGLNSTHKPIIKDLLLDDGAGVVYSQQHVTGGNLKKLVAGVSSVDALEFAVEYIDDNTFAIYTFSKLKLNSAAEGDYIDTYKTFLVKSNGVWDATICYIGTAPVLYVTVRGDTFKSIDETKWEQAKK